MQVNRLITLSAPLPANLTLPYPYNSTDCFVAQSYSFTDGLKTLNEGNSTPGLVNNSPDLGFCILQTDSNGLPLDWYISATQYSPPIYAYAFFTRGTPLAAVDSAAAYVLDPSFLIYLSISGGYNHYAGTWTQGVAPPNPSFLGPPGTPTNPTGTIAEPVNTATG